MIEGARQDELTFIGGSGGSGTRVFARILREAGAFIGLDLNPSLDDQVFNFLFKHPQRFAHLACTDPSTVERREIRARLDLHRHLFFGDRPLPSRSLRLLLRSGMAHANGRYSWRWVIRRLLAQRRRPPSRPRVAICKEPHTMYFVRCLAEHYPKVRYVHVLRNGLDMVSSRHQQDLSTWGPTYGIDPARRTDRNVFELWYRSNATTVAEARSLFGSRCLVVKLEDVCKEPGVWVPRVLEHCQVRTASSSRLCEIPRLPPTHGRYRRRPMDWIDADVEAKLGELGYTRAFIDNLQP